LTKGRIAMCTNRANVYNEKAFNLNGCVTSSLFVYMQQIVQFVLFKQLFHINANVYL